MKVELKSCQMKKKALQEIVVTNEKKKKNLWPNL